MEEAPPGLEPDIEVGVEFLFSGPVNAVRTFVEHVYVTPLPNPVAVGARDGGAPAKIPLNPPHPIRAGERTVVHKVTIYRKLLRLTARDLRTCDERAARELWQVSVFNEDGSADVARYARLMCAVAMEVYDRDTGSAREIVLSERDGRVTLVERGRAPRPPPPS